MGGEVGGGGSNSKTLQEMNLCRTGFDPFVNDSLYQLMYTIEGLCALITLE